MSPEPDREQPKGTVHPTPAGVLVGAGCLGLVSGWGLRQVALRSGWTEPGVGWPTILLIAFVAAFLCATAWLTSRARHTGDRLEAHRAVNRLVLAKACAVVGALIAGGYTGYAVAQLGGASELAETRLWHSALAALAGLGVMVAALWLEHACRVPDGEK